jgi:putative chitinase
MKNLEKIVPRHILPYIEETFQKFEINTLLRASHFLAQVMHESGDFKFKEENLNYSAKALRKVFGKYFPTDELANQYARQPQKIANRVYANRGGNGDEKSGDGWKFRGRGDIQTTLHDNYLSLGGFLGVDLISNPDLVATPRYARLSAGYYWHKNKLNLIADKGDSDSVVKTICLRVNGGYNGLDDRLKRFKKINSILKES